MYLESFLASPRSFPILNIQGDNLDDNEAIEIANALQTYPTIPQVNLSRNRIGGIGATALLNTLQSNIALRALWLNDNNIDDYGARALASFLKTNQTLSLLNMSKNNISNEGAIEVGEALLVNPCLSNIDLAHNNIGNEGVISLVGCIANNNNTRLTSLNLCDNNITLLPIQLVECNTLRIFCYSGNPIDHIPPPVHRWIGRFQQQNNANIHTDQQNVHNRQIQQCIKDSFHRIMNSGSPKYKTFEEIRDAILNDKILSVQCKTQLLEYASDRTEHSALKITFVEALQYVFTRIEINENRDEIKKILNQEMLDALCMCFTGRISRLLNCLTAIDPLVHIHIANLLEMFNNVGKHLKQEGTYNAQLHISQFEEELRQYGYEMTPEFQANLQENFYNYIEDFEEGR